MIILIRSWGYCTASPVSAYLALLVLEWHLPGAANSAEPLKRFVADVGLTGSRLLSR